MSDIYQREELLEIYKNPQNRGILDNPSVNVTESNPMCGDVLTIMLDIKDSIIVDVKYDGDACAVAIISAALVTEDIIGRNLAYVKGLTKDYVLSLLNTDLTTSRIKCATLILDALKKAVSAYESKS